VAVIIDILLALNQLMIFSFFLLLFIFLLLLLVIFFVCFLVGEHVGRKFFIFTFENVSNFDFALLHDFIGV